MWYIKETHFPPNVCQSSKFIDRCRIFSTSQRSQIASRSINPRVSRSILSIRLSRRVGTRQLEQSTGIPVSRPPDAIPLVVADKRECEHPLIRITRGYFPTGFSRSTFFHSQRRPLSLMTLALPLSRSSIYDSDWILLFPRNHPGGFREIARLIANG